MYGAHSPVYKASKLYAQYKVSHWVLHIGHVQNLIDSNKINIQFIATKLKGFVDQITKWSDALLQKILEFMNVFLVNGFIQFEGIQNNW